MITSKNDRQTARALRVERGMRKKAKRHGMTQDVVKNLRAAQNVIESLEVEDFEEVVRPTRRNRKDWE